MAYVYKNTDVEALDAYFSDDLGTAFSEAQRLLRDNPGSLVETTTHLGELGGIGGAEPAGRGRCRRRRGDAGHGRIAAGEHGAAQRDQRAEHDADDELLHGRKS